MGALETVYGRTSSATLSEMFTEQLSWFWSLNRLVQGVHTTLGYLFGSSQLDALLVGRPQGVSQQGRPTPKITCPRQLQHTTIAAYDDMQQGASPLGHEPPPMAVTMLFLVPIAASCLAYHTHPKNDAVDQSIP